MSTSIIIHENISNYFMLPNFYFSITNVVRYFFTFFMTRVIYGGYYMYRRQQNKSYLQRCQKNCS